MVTCTDFEERIFTMGKILRGDNSAQKAAQRAQEESLRLAQEQAALAAKEKAAAEAEEKRLAAEDAKRKENIKRSGRAATILAGEGTGSLLGS